MRRDWLYHFREFRGAYAAAAMFVVIFTVYIAKHQTGWAVPVLTTAANKGVLLAIVAMAQTLPVLTSGIDLSVGMVFVLTNCLASHLVVGTPLHAAAGCVAVLATGALCGFVNGAIIVWGRLQPIVTDNPNVQIVMDDMTKLTNVPEKADMVWTTDNYHDFHNRTDMAAFNKAVFDALKPGGVFLVEDHAAAPGAGATVTGTLHRIEPATVRQEVTAAGFKLVRTSDVLANPADNHIERNADTDIRGKTDRFVFVFQKP